MPTAWENFGKDGSGVTKKKKILPFFFFGIIFIWDVKRERTRYPLRSRRKAQTFKRRREINFAGGEGEEDNESRRKGLSVGRGKKKNQRLTISNFHFPGYEFSRCQLFIKL